MAVLRVLVASIWLTFVSLSHAAVVPDLLAEVVTKENYEYSCSFAPSQHRILKQLNLLASAAGVGVGAELILLTNYLKYVKHSSGTQILTASGRYLPNTLGSAGQFVVPAALVVAGAVVAVELVCVPANNPELVTKLKENTTEYISIANVLLDNVSVKAKKVSSSKIDSLRETFSKYTTLSEDKFYELIGETWYQRTVRKTKAVFQSD